MSEAYLSEDTAPGAVKVTWFGHSLFLFEEGEVALLTDPYGEGYGYAVPQIRADIVLVSHGHHDHSNVAAVAGDPVVLEDATAPRAVKGIDVRGVETAHDAAGGAERGANWVFAWEMGGINFVHMGDIGHRPTAEQTAAIGRPDVLLLPVGGIYTVDAAGAEDVVRLLQPRLVIPMHYKTEDCLLPLAEVDEFASRFRNVERAGKQPVWLRRETLPEELLVLVMNPI